MLIENPATAERPYPVNPSPLRKLLRLLGRAAAGRFRGRLAF